MSVLSRITSENRNLFDVVFEIIAEYVGYRTGRVVLGVLTPQIGIEPSERQRHTKILTAKLTYVKKGAQSANRNKRYYFYETVESAGIAFWAIVAAVGSGVGFAL